VPFVAPPSRISGNIKLPTAVPGERFDRERVAVIMIMEMEVQVWRSPLGFLD
jgi:hypothetical protein